MKAAGSTSAARNVTSLPRRRRRPAFIREMKAAGVKIDSAKDATSLRAVGVTPGS
jgi:ribosomal protein S11